ncbi:MAG: PQQ-dependent dehydrogenase, methanol/ethanol family, partial [Gammaproteobacteria bacterium]|nr:PQQ-dependent dehydrogenase, methanol/ethanol family [Gammaproteobacteria bacterium]NNL52040.1 PQQ-dependent dehydrogenase, methanol/ethanol family [Woeseiaceae bacterium]
MRSAAACLLVFLASLILCGGDSLAAGDVTEARVLAEAGDGQNWLVKGGNFRGEHFSPLADINEKTVADLGLEWARDLPVPDGISATPIVVDGVIYLSGAYSLVFAIDAANGEMLWQFDPDVRSRLAENPQMSWTARVNRGVAVWQGKVLATTVDCRLIALDAETGKKIWSKQTCDPALGYRITDSPYVGGNHVFVGNAGSESYEKNRGYVSAYDIDSGDLVWRFYIVPSDKPEENTSTAMKMAASTWSGTALEEFGGGGSNWNEMTYDPESGLLFFGTAGAIPYDYHRRSPDGGDNLFLSSIVAVDAGTGEYVWHYQTVPEDSWEYNATMNIVLADLNIGGEQRQTLLVAPKNGFHYVLDRLTGELIAADNYAKVNWATHINLETGRPVYDPAAEFWKRPDESVAIWPNMWGAHSWNAMAFHPGLKLVYIPVIDVPTIVSGYKDGDYDDTLEMLSVVNGEPFDPGKLVAWDPIKNESRWTVGYDLPFNGGILTTAGNLVFQGDAHGHFNAYAADSGEKLWSVATGSNITAAPVSFSLNGRQHVLVPVGAGGGIQFVYPQMHAGDEVRGPTRLMAFALDADTPMPTFDVQARALPAQPKLQATAEEIEAGRQLYSLECKGCHGKNAVARFGGSVPDLRYATVETHEVWHGIVIGGALQVNG